MSQFMNTREGQSGENDDAESSASSLPTLKEFLSRCLGQKSNEIHGKLQNMGVTDMNTLIFADDQDLQKLLNELGLTFGANMTIKAQIRKLQHSLKLHQQHTVVTISPEEQAMLNQINLAIQQSHDIQSLFEAYFNSIEDHVNSTKQDIEREIDNVIKALTKRKKTLLDQVDQWKVQKLESVNAEIAKIVEYAKEVNGAKQSINEMLKRSDVMHREEKMRQIVNAIFAENGKHEKYQKVELLRQCVQANMTLVAITYDAKIDAESYGAISDDTQSDRFRLPSIEITDIKKVDSDEKEQENQVSVRLDWRYQPPANNKSDNDEKIDFVVKQQVIGDEDTSDDAKQDDPAWTALNNLSKAIKRDKTDSYFVEMKLKQSWDKDISYQFMVQSMIKQPVHFLLESNIKGIQIKSVWPLDLGKEQQIPLTVHSHRGHAYDHIPEKLFQSNDELYASEKGTVRDDWIIFSAENNRFYPTKVQIRNRDLQYDLKKFRVKIGNANSNEWVNLNEQLFVASKQSGFETFMFDIIDGKKCSANQSVIRKWKTIKIQKYHQFKLEMVDNHGDSNHIVFREFKLFGVQM